MKATPRHGLLLAVTFAALLAGFLAATSLASTSPTAAPAPQPTMIPF